MEAHLEKCCHETEAMKQDHVRGNNCCDNRLSVFSFLLDASCHWPSIMGEKPPISVWNYAYLTRSRESWVVCKAQSIRARLDRNVDQYLG